MERLKLRFAETAKPEWGLVKRDDAFGGELLMDITKYLKKYRYYVFI